MFTPIETSIGAVLLHQATSVLLFQNGSILGASGYLRRLFSNPTRSTLTFFVGMAASFLPLKLFIPELLTRYPPVPSSFQSALLTAGIGALIGWGTKLSNGCTSGHMLCGLARLNARSALAVATFFPVALITHHLVHPTLLTDMCTGQMPCYTPIYPHPKTTISVILLAAFTIYAARTIPRLVAKATSADNKPQNNSAAQDTTQFFAGLQFGLGLHISGMAHPAKVASFLSFPNLDAWDPSLGLVILFGVLPNMIEIQTRGFNTPPLFKAKFELPTKTLKDTDWKFVLGAAAFGIGWGLTGICPGPAVLRAIAQPSWGLLWMTGFWLGGQAIREGDIVRL